MKFRPLLSPRESPSTHPELFASLRGPFLVSVKIDGIRNVVKKGVSYSRTFIPHNSYQVQDEFVWCDHFDGELTVGKPNDPLVLCTTQSHVRSFNNPSDTLVYRPFDYTHEDWLDKPFHKRLERLIQLTEVANVANVKAVTHRLFEKMDDIFAFEEEALAAGWEGLMLRDPMAPYKQNRATWNDGIIYKLKRFEDDEGIITGFYEAMTNNNEKEESELGYAKRSKRQEGLSPAGMLGGFFVDYKGQELRVPCGKLPHSDRIKILKNQSKYLGKELTFTFTMTGAKDMPRNIRAKALRHGL